MANSRTNELTNEKTSLADAASRRDLLKGLSLAGLAAGTASLVAAPAAAGGFPAPSDPHQTQFNETDHVRKFYELARR